MRTTLFATWQSDRAVEAKVHVSSDCVFCLRKIHEHLQLITAVQRKSGWFMIFFYWMKSTGIWSNSQVTQHWNFSTRFKGSWERTESDLRNWKIESLFYLLELSSQGINSPFLTSPHNHFLNPLPNSQLRTSPLPLPLSKQLLRVSVYVYPFPSLHPTLEIAIFWENSDFTTNWQTFTEHL